MTLKLYAHPFSSYCQKALIALWENDTAFEYRSLDDPQAGAELAALWPLRRFPVLVDAGRTVVEATVIIEHLQRFHGGPRPMIPDDPLAALDVRTLDRIFDNYVMTPMQAVVANALRPADQRDPYGVAKACEMLEASYAWLDRTLGGRQWACGDVFGLADCAAAPSLFYADWVYEIAPQYARLRGYRQRLLARPSVARAVDEARPFRSYFPLPVPDRD
ncbi:glutathione S-transferase family protein [Solimonas marina]|uniref:Glutathione S-transferase family protein n=1 Tax=Solimonas marina TaxID=2714601 RepID=A0A969W5N5_9GAMM|nr:glutathione S-transferase family protein [Solimonas marina]NKF20907.1 glutathione S-transferase family protein [Solimonas marina]